MNHAVWIMFFMVECGLGGSCASVLYSIITRNMMLGMMIAGFVVAAWGLTIASTMGICGRFQSRRGDWIVALTMIVLWGSIAALSRFAIPA